MARTPAKNIDVDELAKAGIFVDAPSIEVADSDVDLETISSDKDLSKIASDEAFLNELVKIRVATTTDPNAPPYATVTVNDVRNRVQIPRGAVVPVKRMHVEVLARMRETKYRQHQNNMDPEAGNVLHPTHAMVYPFEIVEDKNPLGRAWYERILAEPTY